jgi:hypothetical protein
MAQTTAPFVCGFERAPCGFDRDNESERSNRMWRGEGCTGSRSAICLGLGGLVAVAMLSAVALGPGAVAWGTGNVGSELTWKDYLGVVDQALARGDVGDAARSWQDAYGVAVASRRWDALLAAGEAFVRIGEVSGHPEGARPNARHAYMAALMQAERQGSVQGVRAVGRAFEALGDRDVAAYCDRIAAALPTDGVVR